MKHNLETYLSEYNTLTPSDLMVGSEVTQSDWWSGLKSQFDDLIWLYYPQRTIFINDRFKPDDSQTTYNNIIRTFTIWIKSHKRQLDRLYVGYMADFNPLWNVDGVEGFVSKDEHTGTITDAHTGDDRLTYEDNGNSTRSGSVEDKRSVKTFDDGTNWKDESKNDSTYNQLKDTRDYDGFKNQNYDSENERTNDLLDEHVDLRIRQGNIGVTQSDKILGDAQRLYQNELMDFYKYVVRSCVNQVSYAVEGVF